jgi:multidrug efflux pump subunit AcrA (membrane-fusion protein)
MTSSLRWCGALAIALLTSQSLLAQQGDAKVEVAKAVSRSLPGSFTFVGTVHPARRAVLGSAVDGRLIEIVEDGTHVRKGQPIARMRTGTINIEIEGAKAELALRQDEDVEMQAGMREEEVAMAEAKLHSSQALANFAKSRYERVKTLYSKGQAISQEEVEQALSAFTAADKNMAAAQSEYDLAKKGHRDERKLQAKDRVAMQKEVLNQLRDRRNKYWVRAYFDGYIVTQHADVGAWIKQGDPLVEIIELDTVEITVNVPEHHIDRVRLGSPAQVRIEAVSPKDAWTGEIISINPQADLRSRTFAVKVRLKNEEVAHSKEKPVAAIDEAEKENGDVEPSDLNDTPEDAHVTPGEMKQYRFKSGMLSHVTMRIGEKQDAILIPKDALVLGGSSVDGQPSYTVYVAAPNKMTGGYAAQPVPVAIGMFDGDWVEVVSRVPGALANGTLVVTLGNERLRPMQGIQFKTPK